MKPVIIAICGQTATGKDSLAHYLSYSSKGKIHNIVSDTTRPKRVSEKEDVDYHFISVAKFRDNIYNDKYLEWNNFRGWYYGTPQHEVQTGINVGVFDPVGLAQLQDRMSDYYVLPVYIKSPIKDRIARYIKRDNRFSLECLRRLVVDARDFVDIETLLGAFTQHIVVKNFSDKQKFLKKAQHLVSKALYAYYHQGKTLEKFYRKF